MSRMNSTRRALMGLIIILSLAVLSCRLVPNIQSIFATPTPTLTLTPTPTPTPTPEPTPIGGAEWIVFASKTNNDDDSDIYAIRADGSGLRQLTSDTSNEWSPALSPDGQSVVFVSDRDGDKNLYLINIDGSNLRQLTFVEDDDYDPAWSPDGRKIAFVSKRVGSNKTEIWILTLATGDVKLVTYDDFDDEDPSWSPDGRFIAYSSFREGGGYDIYIANIDGTQTRRVTEGRDFDRSPKWSPDGQTIIFTRWDTSGIEQNRSFLLTETWDEQMGILYTQGGIEFLELKGSIYLVKSDGTGLRRLTDDYGSWAPCWSPDGQWIAFASDRDDSGNIYRMKLDDETITPVRQTEAIDSLPSWGGVIGRGPASASEHWEVLISDAFNDNSNDWDVGPLEDSENFWITSNAAIGNGVYHIEGKANQDVVWWVYPDIRSVSNFHLSVRLRLVSGARDGEVGVVFRLSGDGDRYYRFYISPRLQEYTLDLYYDGEWTTLIEATYTPAILPNDWNKVEVEANGAHFSFWINDQYITDVYDSTLDRGKVGITIGLLDPGDEGVFEFDDFEVRVP